VVHDKLSSFVIADKLVPSGWKNWQRVLNQMLNRVLKTNRITHDCSPAGSSQAQKLVLSNQRAAMNNFVASEDCS
jgi:hypothetical protein